MALANSDDLISGLTTTRKVAFGTKTSLSTLAGRYISLWKIGDKPAIGTTPSTAATCTNSTLGAFGFTDASSGSNRLTQIVVRGSTPLRNYILMDRLAHMGGLVASSTASQTVNLSVTSLTSRIGSSDYSDVEWFVECYTATGTSSGTITVTYTNAAGTSGQTATVSAPSSMTTGTMLRIIGTGGEFIQSVQSVQHSPSLGTPAGNYGVVAYRFISEITVNHQAAYCATINSHTNVGLVKIPDGAALCWIHYSGSITTADFDFWVTVMEK